MRKHLLITFLFLLGFIAANAQRIPYDNFFIDLTPTNEEIAVLETYDLKVESNMDSIMVWEAIDVLMTRVEKVELLKLKKKNKLDTYRIYFYANESYDTLGVTGYARTYLILEEGKDSAEMAPCYNVLLEDYKQFLDSNEFDELTDLLLRLTEQSFFQRNVAKNGGRNVGSISFDFIVRDYLILDPYFNLFSCAEVYHYESPYDSEHLKMKVAGDFVSLDYNEQLHPSAIDFSVKMKKEIKSVVRKSGYKVDPSLLFSLRSDYVGLTFKRDNKVKTFWSTKEYITKYFNSDLFDTSVKFFYMNAVRSRFKLNN